MCVSGTEPRRKIVTIESFSSLPLESWSDTRTTLHVYTQIVGKVRLALARPLNHWWHVPFYVSPRGLTTSSIPDRGGGFDMEFDFFDHALVIRTSGGEVRRVALGRPVAEFYRQLFAELSALGIEPKILARPFDPDRVKSRTPFAEDREPRAYDGDAARRFWKILAGIEPIFTEFRGRFLGKCSPVHFFWHSFDLACTRFSGKRVPVPEGADPVTRSAYSHEVISAGFWPGDGNVPEPAFYCYAAPAPDGLSEEKLGPEGARWNDAMALYRYEDFRSAADPREVLLDFLQTSYEAGARRAGWPRAELEA
jgi:hypothetical protein